MVAICLAIKPNFEIRAAQEITRDLLNLLLCFMYFKMITNFITDFHLQTKVNADGSVDILGIDRNGYEVFKFALDDERKQGLLGIDAKDSNLNDSTRRQSVKEANS